MTRPKAETIRRSGWDPNRTCGSKQWPYQMVDTGKAGRSDVFADLG